MKRDCASLLLMKPTVFLIGKFCTVFNCAKGFATSEHTQISKFTSFIHTVHVFGLSDNTVDIV